MSTPGFLSKRIRSAPNKEELRAHIASAIRRSANMHAVSQMYTQSSFVRDLACLP